MLCEKKRKKRESQISKVINLLQKGPLQVLLFVWGLIKYGLLVDTTKIFFGVLLVEFGIQVFGKGIVSGSSYSELSRRVLGHFSLSDKIKINKYLVKKGVESHVNDNYSWRLTADQGKGVVYGSSALDGVEYKCSDGDLSGPLGFGFSRRVHDYISLSDKIKINKYLMRKCVESFVDENSRTNYLPSLNMFIPCWDVSSHLAGWLLVQCAYLGIWCVGYVPLYVVLYILLSVYRSANFGCEVLVSSDGILLSLSHYTH